MAKHDGINGGGAYCGRRTSSCIILYSSIVTTSLASYQHDELSLISTVLGS